MAVTVDDSATENAHQACIERHGESYVAAALDAGRPPETRARALTAAVKLLSSAPATRSPTARGGIAAAPPTQNQAPGAAKLASVVAASVDDAVPVAALVNAAEAAADAMQLTVLGKVLCLLARKKALYCAGGEAEGDGDDDDAGDGEGEDAGGVDEGEEGEEGADANEISGDEGAGEGGDGRKRKKESSAAGAKRRKKPKAAARAKGTKQMRSVAADGSGQAYVDEFVTRLSGASPAQAAAGARRNDDVFVATTARESPLSPEAVAVVLENLVGRLRQCDVFELPAFIYQLLLLVSTRGNAAAKRHVLHAIVVCFADLEEAAEGAALEASHTQQASVDDVIQSGATVTVLRQVQSTTLLHIDFAVKQDPGLVSELTRLARAPADSPHSIMAPFGVAVLLALSRAPSVQLSVMGTIRDAILRFDKEVARRAENVFAARVCKSDTDAIRDPRAALCRAVESTARDGWDLVCEPLLRLSFLLIDKCPLVWSPVSTAAADGKATEAELGANMLVDLFSAHRSLRSEIVDQVVSRIVLREKSSPLAVDVLSRLARRSPSDLLECAGKIKESVADLVTLPPWTSCALISAYKPLFRVRPDLQDYLHLALRKALFHREPSARAVASTGFLRLIAPSDAGECDAGPAMAAHTPPADALEDTVQPLRRALTYPPAIRALLYKDMRRLAGR
jgi:hypothetical protein